MNFSNLDVSFNLSEMSSPSLGDPPASPMSLQCPRQISSPVSPPYSPWPAIATSCPSSPVLDQCVVHSPAMHTDPTLPVVHSPAIDTDQSPFVFQPRSFSPLLSMDSLPQPQPPSSTCQQHGSSLPSWHGFKIVGDNIDKNVKPRHQTLERHTHSLHYFNSYAVQDRLNLHHFSNKPPQVNLQMLETSAILPSQEDVDALLHNFAILAGRIIHKYIPSLSEIPHLVTDHIRHPHYQAMSSKSKVVRRMLSIGISCHVIDSAKFSTCRFLLG